MEVWRIPLVRRKHNGCTHTVTAHSLLLIAHAPCRPTHQYTATVPPSHMTTVRDQRSRLDTLLELRRAAGMPARGTTAGTCASVSSCASRNERAADEGVAHERL